MGGVTEPIGQEMLAREELRELAKTNLYFLAKAILNFHDVTKRTHWPLCVFSESAARRKLILAPRGTFKSSICTVAYIVQRIITDPDVRILLVSAAQENASKFLGLIQAQFTNNATFRYLFPELSPNLKAKDKWSQTAMTVPRPGNFPEATVEAMGVGSTVVSRHYDEIVNDDLVDEKIAESPGDMARVLRWYQAEESLLVNPKVGKIRTVGTRWSYGDVYGWMLAEEPGLDVFLAKAHNPDGTPFFPERLDDAELDRLRKKQGSYMFSCLYDNTPQDLDAASLRRSWLRYHRIEGDMLLPESGGPIRLADCRRLMRVDPAISESSRAARTAIVVDAVAPDGRKFLLDVWAERCQPSDMFEAIFRLDDRWDVERVGVESVAYQRAIKPFLEAEAQRRTRWLNVVELRPDTRKSKEARIRATQPYLERGEVSVAKEHTLFLDEYEQFPFGKTVDVLDAWAYGPTMWEAPLDEPEDDTAVEEWAFASAMDGRSALTGY